MFLVFFVTIAIIGIKLGDSVQTTVVSLGRTVHFNCDTNTGSHTGWDRFPTISQRRQTISSRGKVLPQFSGRFNITYLASSRATQLSITNVSFSDAGIYLCTDVYTSRPTIGYSLTIIDQVPEFRTYSAPDGLGISYSVFYTGDRKPLIACQNSAREIAGGNPATTYQQLNDSTRSIYRQRFTVNKYIQGSVFTCSVTIVSREEILYNDTWTSQPVNTTYGPVAVEVTTNGSKFLTSGDILTCTADSNPQPDEFRWIINNRIVGIGPVYRLDPCNFVSVNAIEKSLIVQSVECVASRSKRSATGSLDVVLVWSTQDAQRCGYTKRLKSHENASADIIVVFLILMLVGVTAAIAFVWYKRQTATDRLKLQVETDILCYAEEIRDEVHQYMSVLLDSDSYAEPFDPRDVNMSLYESIPADVPAQPDDYQNIPQPGSQYEWLNMETLEPPRPAPLYTSLNTSLAAAAATTTTTPPAD